MGEKSRRRRFITQAKSIILLDIIILVIGAFWDLIFPAFNRNIPPATNLIALVWGVGFLFIVRYTKLMSPYEAATPDIILQTAMDPILLLNSDGLILKANQATKDMLGLGDEQILGRPLSDFLKAGAYDRVRLNELLSSKQLKSVEIDLLDAGGNTVNTLSSFSLAESKLDGPVGIVATMHDVTALKSFETELRDRNTKYQVLLQQLEEMVNHDILTGLPNRRILFAELDSAIANYHATGKGFALLFIDLDGFKGINDIFGHNTGDQLLQKVSELFLSSVRETDTVCRIGGDEFIIILRSGENGEQLLAERLRNLFLDPLVVNGDICRLGLSCGISRCPADAVTGDELMRIADYRMYSEKERHKKFEFLTPEA